MGGGVGKGGASRAEEGLRGVFGVISLPGLRTGPGGAAACEGGWEAGGRGLKCPVGPEGRGVPSCPSPGPSAQKPGGSPRAAEEGAGRTAASGGERGAWAPKVCSRSRPGCWLAAEGVPGRVWERASDTVTVCARLCAWRVDCLRDARLVPRGTSPPRSFRK